MIMKMQILDFTIEELEWLFPDLGMQAYRARQVLDWLYKGVTDFKDMKNLPADIQEKLDEEFEIYNPKIVREQVSKEDGTRKFLLEYSDGNAIETVFMKYKYGNSICVSSQAGCRMGCKFCASTLNGLRRDLTSGEILAQLLTVERAVKNSLASEKGEASSKEIDPKEWKINHIVVMGTGEPFDNYLNVMRFIQTVHDPRWLNISNRNITVSTCGVVSMLKLFAEDCPQVNLAISLHATTDDVRSSMMPINRMFPIEKIMEAAKEYTKKTKRRITFEYTMVNGVNDSDEDVKRLANLLKGMLCHVNLIPLNKVEGTGFDTVSRKRAEEFAEILEKAGIAATVRRELGADIDAACGQLRLKKNQNRH